MEEGKLTHNQLEEAIKIQKETREKLGEIFIKLRYVTEEDIAFCISSQFGLAYLEISRYKVDTSLLSQFTYQEISENSFFPLDLFEKILVVAICGPINQEYFLNLEERLGVNIFFIATTAGELKEAIKSHTKYFKGAAV
ncbi:MAG: hypothetical protein ACK4NF_01560 [Planctomycetota bacterium]